MSFGMGTQAAQNAAHRADTMWVKIGPSEYLRSDGVTIAKDKRTGYWGIYLPTGERAAAVYDGDVFTNTAAGGSSLTWAKLDAATITTATPAYSPVH